MTPGTYLRKRRMAANLTIDQVAETLAVLPNASGPSFTTRVDMLKHALLRIEANVEIMAPTHAKVVQAAFSFDPTVYSRLILVSQGMGSDLPRLCDECACTTFEAAHSPLSSVWSTTHPGLCRSCAPGPRAAHQTANAYYRAGASA